MGEHFLVTKERVLEHRHAGPCPENLPRIGKEGAAADLTGDGGGVEVGGDSLTARGKRGNKANEKARGRRDHQRAGERGSRPAVGKAGAQMEAEDLQRMACSRTEAARTSVRKMTAARTVRSLPRTRDGCVLGGGSAGRRGERSLDQQTVGLGTEP